MLHYQKCKDELEASKATCGIIIANECNSSTLDVYDFENGMYGL